jgi:hypothetical protein
MLNDFFKKPWAQKMALIILIIVLITGAYFIRYSIIRPSVSPETMSVPELLEHGTFNSNVTVYGQRTLTFGSRYCCPCFDIGFGKKLINVETDGLDPNPYFQAETNGTDDGDWILVYGYYEVVYDKVRIRAWRIEKL